MEQAALRDIPKEANASAPPNFSDLQIHAPANNASPEYALAAGALPQITLSESMATDSGNPNDRSVVVVSKADHTTHVLQMHEGKVVDVLSVPDATGKGPKMTPEGRFHITAKEQHPTWYPPPSIGGHPVGPGPHNPLGVAKIRTDAFSGRILLHGTNRPDQIGTNASHGCIRHNNEDILKIYPLVRPGDAVYIVKHFEGTHIRPEDFNARKK